MHRRIDLEHPKLLFEVPWEQDCQFRTNPAVLTSLLQEQVPVLSFVEWEVTNVEPGRAESLLPLNAQSTNQHFTHQAALLLLAADYTGGVALGSLMTGWPVVGVHPITSSQSISLWLLKGEIKYMRPSVGDLTISAEVDHGRRDRIGKRFLRGRPVIESLQIHFRNGDIDVAEATLTYFAQQSESLRSDGSNPDKVNTLYELKLTSSAELIAGVRAQESGEHFDDPYAAQMAGQHGLALAKRFCERSPQLAGMVAARTRHLDQEIMRFIQQGGRDLVILGVGWDMRPFRLDIPEGMRVYELDFPTTLRERRRRIADLAIQDRDGVQRIEVPIDLRTKDLECVLQPYLDCSKPVFVAWEGMSMYFQDEEVAAMLQGMQPLFTHPESRLWVDLVDKKAVDHPEEFPEEVQAFMRGMQILGEPFTFGTNSAKELMEANGFHCCQAVPSDTFLQGKTDPIYSVYNFCVASAKRLAAESRGDFAELHPSEELPEPISRRIRSAEKHTEN